MGNMNRVLIVDDEEQILNLLESFIASLGHQVIKARTGEETFAAVQNYSPDMVLLDVRLPDMDGFEVCGKLKKESGYLPVIMVTAMDDLDSRHKGIECGADAFFSKPVDFTELKWVIKNILRFKNLYDELEKSYKSVKELERLRVNMFTFIVHDLRSPLTGVKGYLDLLVKSRSLKQQDLNDINKARENVDLMISMIATLLEIRKLESREIRISPDVYDLGEIVASAVKTVEPLFKQREIRFSDETQSVKIQVRVQRDLIERVIQNILTNALKYTPKKGEIRILSEPSGRAGYVIVSISDTGCGIPCECHEAIFDMFGTVEVHAGMGRRSTGLGLTFCKLAVEMHGGKIWVEDRPDGGTVFKFTLPI
ncbi:MAG: response regulator [bacterium]